MKVIVLSLPSLPPAFIKRILERSNGDGEALLRELAGQRVSGLRVNTLKTTTEEIRQQLPFNLQPVPWCREGFYYNHEDRPGLHPLYRAGLYYIQEPSAMYTVEALGVNPGDRVLDLCAAPGGKSTQALAKLKGRGLLVSNEINSTRASVLAFNLESFGASNFVVTNASAEKLALRLPEFFDKIIVDAPCSGEGLFRKEPETRLHWEAGHPSGCADRQREIIKSAISMLRPGGLLAYSTCTFAEEENEWLVARVTKEHPEMTPLMPPVYPGITLGTKPPSAKLLPHRLRGEGHFCAVLRKDGQASHTKNTPTFQRTAPSREALRALDSFLSGQTYGNIHAYGDLLVALPDHLPDLSGVRVIRAGLKLGEYRGKCFHPDHALALAVPSPPLPRLDLSAGSPELTAYLRGEVVSNVELQKGWILVCCHGHPVGFGKVSDGQVKNHLPKGLRTR